jgi:hypothetical protein
MRLKKIVLLLLFLNKCYLHQAQITLDFKEDKKRLKLNGNIDTLFQTEYLVRDNFGTLVKIQDKSNEEIFVFDNSQRVTSYRETRDGKLEENNFIFYREDSSFVEVKWTKHGVSRIQQFKFDSRGNILEELYFNNDTLFDKKMCKYNDKDSLIEYKEYEKGGGISQFRSWEYDSSNNITKKLHYNNNGWYSNEFFSYKNNKLESSVRYDRDEKKSSQSSYSYDKSNRLIMKVTEWENTKQKYKDTYSYDVKGNLLEHKEYIQQASDYFEQSRVWLYSYDKYDRLVFEGREESGGAFYKHIIKYDHLGNIIEEENIYNHGKETSKSISQFEYDERSNWIKSIHKYIRDTSNMTDVSMTLTQRTIIYK